MFLQRSVTLLCLEPLTGGTADNHLLNVLGHTRPVDYVLCLKINLGNSSVSIMELAKDLVSLRFRYEEGFSFEDESDTSFFYIII